MSSYLRPRVPGATIFFTVRLDAAGGTLLTDEIDRLRHAVAATRRERPFTIDAFVVLPDHLHCVWTLPEGDCEYSERWRLIKSRFSMGLPPGPRRHSHLARNERAIWQRRFWEHHIRDAEDYRAHVAYCRANPVKHGLATSPEDWPFSSVHRDRRLGLL
ncbi:REP-associated tyrosine transposase [Pararhodobacter aggregans]|uniref:Transposase n=1 Tax=Pararhodobacter aggregans TaxID=404875 RepID=A0A2T7UN16_9RHOB|nr:transposase [Pararhodobacter aggregans]PTX02445.1 putative transposase [Pararhodobacter aggregans]PVE46056.1 transposase [Pararhodobacter aggregans]